MRKNKKAASRSKAKDEVREEIQDALAGNFENPNPIKRQLK